MDPHVTLAMIRDAGVELADRLEALSNLANWIQLGGFIPAGLDATRVLRFTMTIGTLCAEYSLAHDQWPRAVVCDLLEKL